MLFILTFAIYFQESPQANQAWRTHMLADIQAAFETHRPTTWDATDPQSHLEVHWNPEFASGEIRFERRFLLADDSSVTLVEIWQMNPRDLSLLLKAWGHPDNPTWESLLSLLPKGRVLANAATGNLAIIRDFEIGVSDWQTPPFPLNALPTEAYPSLAEELEPVRGEDASESETASSFGLFIEDLVNEELQDREGSGIRLSQKWRFEGRASRFNPRLRIERRLKLNFDNTYTVFDIYSAEVDLLVGDRSFRMDDNYTSEAGILFEAEKSFVVVRKGYRKWYDALFTTFFSPTKLPYNAKNLEDLPVGVRIILPTTAGLTLVERYAYTGIAGEDYPLEANAFAGTQSAFFISISKRSSSNIDLRFGARIERPLYLELRGRPDFDGPFDARRLLAGTILQTRLNRIQGSRIFLQKNINLEDAQQVQETVAALRRGIRLSGLILGTAAIFNFTFSPRIDSFLLEKRLKGKLPELDWQSRIESTYREKGSYGKFGLRLFSVRAQKTEIIDDWQVFDLINGQQMAGKSASFTYQRNWRFFKFISRRQLEVLALEDKDAAANTSAASHSVQILDAFSKSRIDASAYLKRASVLRGMLGTTSALDGAGSHPPETRWKKLEMGYRLIISDTGMDLLASHLLQVEDQEGIRSDPLRIFLNRHPILKYRMHRNQDNRKRRDILLGKFLFKVARQKGPLWRCFELLHEKDYYLEYREMVAGQLLDHGRDGNNDLSSVLSDSLKTWQELDVFDDIYIDRSIGNQFDR